MVQAEKLHCSVKAVEKQITRALRVLRSGSGEHGVGLALFLIRRLLVLEFFIFRPDPEK
jgi:hypothetical protein